MMKSQKTDWKLFKALGEPSRFQLFCRLCDCASPATVGQLAEGAPQDVSVVSRHLKALKEVGALTASKKGREMLYQINAKYLANCLRSLADVIENCPCCNPEEGGGCCE